MFFQVSRMWRKFVVVVKIVNNIQTTYVHAHGLLSVISTSSDEAIYKEIIYSTHFLVYTMYGMLW